MVNDAAVENWHKMGVNIYWVNTEFGMLANEVKRVKKL